jgi:oligopeptide/dipeptide ABC transporter ATP-binding protein
VFRVGDQLHEAMALHLAEPRRTLRARALEILARVGIPSAATRARDYPHQFSGGMAQRVMIGMGVSCVPSLLIADEPTTALDVTIQAQVLALIRRLARETGSAVLLVSHDLGIISQMCDRVIVMYAGRVVEEASIATVFRAPAHPYSQALIGCLPRLEAMERLGTIGGAMPGLAALPSGCRFHPRCPRAEARCATEAPPLRAVGAGHRAACHFAGEPPPASAPAGLAEERA